MKKVFALALAVILALGCFGALAEEKYSHTQTERAFGTMEGPWSVSAYDGYDFGADKSKMSAAPQKFTFTDATDKLVEWYSQEKSGKAMPKGKTYRFTAKYYVAEWTEGKIIYCIDRAKFFDMDDDADYMTPGYHETSIEWEADIDCNFINFYIGMNETCNGVVYMSELKVEEVVPGEDPAGPTPAGPYAGFVNASFDYIDTYADAEAKTKLQANVGYEKSAGFGSDALDAIGRKIDSADGKVKAIKVQGWAGFDQEIEEYGYRINGVDTIVAGSKFDSDADKSAVQDPAKGGGQYAHRYGMTIPVGDLKGENKIVVIAKLADGTIVELNGDFNDKLHEYSQTANTSFTFVGPKAEDPKPIPPTGDVAVAFAVVAVAAMAVVVLKKRETI